MGNHPSITYDRYPPRGDTPPILVIGSRDLKTAFVSVIRCINGKFLNLDLNTCIFLTLFKTDNGRGSCAVSPPEHIIVAIALLAFLAGDCPVQVMTLLESDHGVD